jgi:hypothetical protein
MFSAEICCPPERGRKPLCIALTRTSRPPWGQLRTPPAPGRRTNRGHRTQQQRYSQQDQRIALASFRPLCQHFTQSQRKRNTGGDSATYADQGRRNHNLQHVRAGAPRAMRMPTRCCVAPPNRKHKPTAAKTRASAAKHPNSHATKCSCRHSGWSVIQWSRSRIVPLIC